MAAPRKKPAPTQAEREKLRALFTDTLLGSAHGIIQENVRQALADLLTTLNRGDLAAVVLDYDQLLAAV